jgi:hypothetical protein
MYYWKFSKNSTIRFSLLLRKHYQNSFFSGPDFGKLDYFLALKLICKTNLSLHINRYLKHEALHFDIGVINKNTMQPVQRKIISKN